MGAERGSLCNRIRKYFRGVCACFICLFQALILPCIDSICCDSTVSEVCLSFLASLLAPWCFLPSVLEYIANSTSNMRPVLESRCGRGDFQTSNKSPEISHDMMLIFDGNPTARAPNRVNFVLLAGFSTWSLASACTRYWATRQKSCRSTLTPTAKGS